MFGTGFGEEDATNQISVKESTVSLDEGQAFCD